MGAEQSSFSKPMGLNQALSEFSANLVPSDEYRRRAGECTDEIFKLIQRYRRDVDRRILGGSMGKKTAISTGNIPGAGPCKPPDVDIVLFLNDQTPPFERVVQEFILAFKNAEREGYDIHVKNAKDRHFVCVEYKGYSFDIAPAPNLSPHVSPKESHQRAAVMEIIANSGNKKDACRAYGSALAESAVNFMKKQQNAHPLIRLAKFWNSNVKMTKYVFARSYMIECVALDAYRHGLRSGWNLVRMFKHFLRSMSNFDEIFLNVGEGPIQYNFRGVVPLIVDPINPYNNLGQQHPLVIQEFCRAARSTLLKWGDERMVINSWKQLIQLLSPEEEEDNNGPSSYERAEGFSSGYGTSSGPSPSQGQASAGGSSSSSNWSTALKVGAGLAAVGLLVGGAAAAIGEGLRDAEERAERERRENQNRRRGDRNH